MSPESVRVVTAAPGPAERDAIRALAAAVERADGAPALSDQTRSQLDSSAVRHVLAYRGGDLVGYAQVDGSDDDPDAVAEIAAEPAALDALLDAVAAAGSPLIWSHGRRSRLIPARPRDAAALPPDPPVPTDVTVRAFVAGRDDAAWLALNAAAFAHHPEQGRWTQRDLDARRAEPWFDADGFLLAERAGRLVAFHWTKVHPDGAGEVYVLGVDPGAQGTGLGGALLIRGLRHLAERGCPYVLLYVDGDNPTALHLYERDGFVRHDLDVQWR